MPTPQTELTILQHLKRGLGKMVRRHQEHIQQKTAENPAEILASLNDI